MILQFWMKTCQIFSYHHHRRNTKLHQTQKKEDSGTETANEINEENGDDKKLFENKINGEEDETNGMETKVL